MRKVDDGEEKREKNGIFSGHYVIASSLPPERRPPHARANTREVNIETDIVAIIERTGIIYNGENGLSEFESESIQR